VKIAVGGRTARKGFDSLPTGSRSVLLHINRVLCEVRGNGSSIILTSIMIERFLTETPLENGQFLGIFDPFYA
jgi:hypothetical protein